MGTRQAWAWRDAIARVAGPVELGGQRWTLGAVCEPPSVTELGAVVTPVRASGEPPGLAGHAHGGHSWLIADRAMLLALRQALGIDEAPSLAAHASVLDHALAAFFWAAVFTALSVPAQVSADPAARPPEDVAWIGYRVGAGAVGFALSPHLPGPLATGPSSAARAEAAVGAGPGPVVAGLAADAAARLYERIAQLDHLGVAAAALLVIAEVAVARAQIAELRAGLCLRLPDAPTQFLQVAQGRIRVRLHERARGQFHQAEVIGHYQRSAMNNELIDDLDVAVTVVLGQLRLPLAQLARLAPGERLELPGSDGRAEIHVDNKVIARGVLVSVDGALAVRIDELT